MVVFLGGRMGIRRDKKLLEELFTFFSCFCRLCYFCFRVLNCIMG